MKKMKTREQKWVLSVETSLLKHSQEWNLPWELPRHGDNAWEYYLPLILRNPNKSNFNCHCCPVTKLCLILCNPMDHSMPGSRPSWSPGICSNSHPLSQWCHPTISSSVNPLLLLPSIFPSIRVFSNERALHIRWPTTGVSASATVLPMNIQGWFPLGLTGLIPLLSKGLKSLFQHHNSKVSILQHSLTPFLDHSFIAPKRLGQLNEAMSHAVQGHPRWTGQSEEFWQNMVHWRRKWQPTPVFLHGEPHGQYKKGYHIYALRSPHTHTQRMCYSTFKLTKPN